MLDIEIKVMKYFAHEELPMDGTQQKMANGAASMAQ